MSQCLELIICLGKIKAKTSWKCIFRFLIEIHISGQKFFPVDFFDMKMGIGRSQK